MFSFSSPTQRRMEASRRVHFSEEVVAIAPVVFDISMDLDEDSEPEEDSETEEENRTTQGPGGGAKERNEAVARPPTPSPTLPAWIRALKRKSRKKKNP